MAFDELDAGVALLRLEGDLHLGVLARAARLLLVGVGLGVRLRDRLAIGDLRRADVGVHAVFAAQAVDDDLQVQLAHAGQDGLAGLLVGLQPQRGILAGQLLQAERHLLDALLGLRLDGDVDDRHREGHALQHDRVGRVGQGVARAGVLQAHEGGDVAGVDLLDLLALVGVHLEHAADALLVPLRGVHHGVAGLQHARVDAHEGQVAVLVVDDLEGERRRRARPHVGRDDAAVGFAGPLPRPPRARP